MLLLPLITTPVEFVLTFELGEEEETAVLFAFTDYDATHHCLLKLLDALLLQLLLLLLLLQFMQLSLL